MKICLRIEGLNLSGALLLRIYRQLVDCFESDCDCTPLIVVDVQLSSPAGQPITRHSDFTHLYITYLSSV